MGEYDLRHEILSLSSRFERAGTAMHGKVGRKFPSSASKSDPVLNKNIYSIINSLISTICRS